MLVCNAAMVTTGVAKMATFASILSWIMVAMGVSSGAEYPVKSTTALTLDILDLDLVGSSPFQSTGGDAFHTKPGVFHRSGCAMGWIIGGLLRSKGLRDAGMRGKWVI